MSVATLLQRSRRDREDWKYTDLEALLASAPQARKQSMPAPVEGQARLVFVNGIFENKKSQFGAIPSCILMGEAETGYKLTLGEHTCLVAQPVEMVFITDDKAPAEIDVKLSIDIGANGRLTLLERHQGAVVTVLDTDIHLHAHAKFVHGKIVSGGAHLATSAVTVEGGAYYNNFALIRGGQPARNEIEVNLVGPEAQATLNGAMLLRGTEHADTTTRITHKAPQCASRQIYKTVLADKARGVFQGKIIVAPDAQKTDGYQLSRALLLSDQAEMDAKPELEIYADDVKCSHGSAIGDLDEDAMFYLRARGLSENEARALLIEAFIGESFDEVPVEEWRALFRAEMEGWQQ
ncbi:MAG: Fe-S cluster assembly protein SufD [Alphaproteobacteria bacterium]|nr:Fe-S cluster assembly protein SufD [Alphaproteobacteria bacterium]